jgi:hypothetical protein
MTVVDGIWRKYICDGCSAHALAFGEELPLGWRVTTRRVALTQHVCSEECGEVLALDSNEPTPITGTPIFLERCIHCGSSDCAGHDEPL